MGRQIFFLGFVFFFFLWFSVLVSSYEDNFFNYTHIVNFSNPSSFDLRDYGWISPIKDQGDCGSCTAFTVASLLEARARMDLNDSNYDIDLSEQFILSCSEDISCIGGFKHRALDFVVEEGVVSNYFLDYRGVDVFSYLCENTSVGRLSIPGYYRVSDGVFDTVKHVLVNYGPVAARMYVYEDFKNYTGGVYSYESGDFLFAHSVLLIGYNDSGNYWILKNSWGDEWGEDGFFRLDYKESALFNLSSIQSGIALNEDEDVLDRRRVLSSNFFLFVKETDITSKPSISNLNLPSSVDWFEEFNISFNAYPSSVKFLENVYSGDVFFEGDLSFGGNFSASVYPFELGCIQSESVCDVTFNAVDDAGFSTSKSISLNISYESVESNLEFVKIEGDGFINPGFVLSSNNSVGADIFQYSFDNGSSWWVFQEPVLIDENQDKILYRVVDIFGNTEPYNVAFVDDAPFDIKELDFVNSNNRSNFIRDLFNWFNSLF